MNAIYFLTYTIDGGDGNDIWPWTSPIEKNRYDVSKLAQWEKVFTHMEKRGVLMHFVLQETENDEVLGANTYLSLERKLYHREMVARFGHHLGLVWNIGEENDVGISSDTIATVTDGELHREALIENLSKLDPYNHRINAHSHPDDLDDVYNPLLSNLDFSGPALQIGWKPNVNKETIKWLTDSMLAGKQWMVSFVENGPAHEGALPDDVTTDNHKDLRQHILWGHLMAGGAGVEWYFGYNFHDNDLNSEDWRARDNLWEQTRIAKEFFENHLPYWEMESMNDSLNIPWSTTGYALGKEDEVYAVYLSEPTAGAVLENLPIGNYVIKWFDPLLGGVLFNGTSVSCDISSVDQDCLLGESGLGGDSVALISKN